MADKPVRIDKWLWSIRFFKTRTKATDACKSGVVKNVDGHILKPSYEIKIGDVINVKKSGIIFTIKVLKNISSRVSAILAKECFEDLTPESELEKFEMWYFSKKGVEFREKGSGRPTKKERRDIDDFKISDFDSFDYFEEL
ncbi:MAG: RNA-binding S4 domain-containing protein [Saprospiraceae bacterium]